MIAAVPLRLSYSIFQLVLLLAHRLAHRVRILEQCADSLRLPVELRNRDVML